MRRMRQIFFFDTPDLALNAAGVVVRARRIQDSAADTVVKLRPVVPDDLPKKLAEGSDRSAWRSTRCRVGSCVRHPSKAGRRTMKSKRRRPGRDPSATSTRKIQRAFYAEHAPDGIGLDDLVVLGPIPVLKLKLTPEGFGRKLAVELWQYPDGSQDPRALDEVPPRRRDPGRRGGKRASRVDRDRSLEQTADEDRHGSAVLRPRTEGRVGPRPSLNSILVSDPILSPAPAAELRTDVADPVSVAGASIGRWPTRARSCTRTPTRSTRRSSSGTTRRSAAGR